jgi:hypothetical protein
MERPHLDAYVAQPFFDGDLILADASSVPSGRPRKYAVTFVLVASTKNDPTVRLHVDRITVCGVSAFANWQNGMEGVFSAKISAFVDELPDPAIRYRLMPRRERT